MATPIPLMLLFLISFSSASRHSHNVPTSSTYSETQFSDIITQSCKASHDPPKCQSSLSQSPQSATTAAEIIKAAISISSKNLNDSRIMIQNILESFTGDKNGTTAAQNCLELIRYSEYRINLVNDALPRGAIKDAHAWMSSVLGYQYGCWSGLKYVNTSSLVAQTMSFFNNTLIASTSDVLGMMASFDVYGEDFGSWAPPRTERDGYWEPDSGVSGSGFMGCVPSSMEVNVTVCKSSCDYSTIQDAVNAAPDNLETGNRFVIRIRAGVYEEIIRIPLEKKNVVFLGDGIGKTVITGSMNVGLQGVSTYDSATVGVIGDGFMASDLTIQNTAGPDAHQAVAFRSDSDLSFIENCEFLGNQDTLYAHSLRQYYKSCRIQGNVDFIFGNSASYFQDCLILIAPRQTNPEKGETNAVTAHGRIDPGQTTGFVFQNCVINGTDSYMSLYYSKPKVHKNFLGRPWKQYSRTIFVGCELEALIAPGGWMPWYGDFALQTLYYGEFESGGTGANVSGRVPWSSQVPADHVQSYSTQNFIQGDHWIPTSSSCNAQ